LLVTGFCLLTPFLWLCSCFVWILLPVKPSYQYLGTSVCPSAAYSYARNRTVCRSADQSYLATGSSFEAAV